MNQESLWQVAQRAAFRTWRRDLIGLPVAALLVLLGLVVLYGRDYVSTWDWGHLLPIFLLSCVAWPVAYTPS